MNHNAPELLSSQIIPNRAILVYRLHLFNPTPCLGTDASITYQLIMKFIVISIFSIPSGWWLTYPSEKYEFVSWDYDIPNIWKIIKFMFQTTNQPFISIYHQPVLNTLDRTNSKYTVITSSFLIVDQSRRHGQGHKQNCHCKHKRLNRFIRMVGFHKWI